MSLILLTREEWGAVPSKRRLVNTIHPIQQVFNISTNTNKCEKELECIKVCQEMQLRDIERGYGDIRFNFIVGGDGQVYEGRGWNHIPALPKDAEQAVPTSCILIAFIGKWKEYKLPPIMIRASSDLIDYGIEKEYLARNFKSKDLFRNLYRELVELEIIRQGTLEIAKNKAEVVKFVRDMGFDIDRIQTDPGFPRFRGRKSKKKK